MIETFAAAAEEGRRLSAVALDRIDAVELPEEIAWTPRTRDGFLRILRGGEAGVRTLEAMDRIELLGRFLPEWRPVRCRPQRDPYHRFTVDMHLMQAWASMGRMLADADRGGPSANRLDGEVDRVAIEAARTVEDHDALLLGALLHDIGKTGEGPHVPIGVRAAERLCDRMCLDAGTGDLVRFMVGHHLLLPDTATRRDLGDEDLVMDVAARISTPERLAALYLLAAADASATGPHAWTPWRQTLVRELVGKVQRVFERGEMGSESAEVLRGRVDAIRRLLADEDERAVDAFLDRMPPAYLLVVDPEDVDFLQDRWYRPDSCRKRFDPQRTSTLSETVSIAPARCSIARRDACSIEECSASTKRSANSTRNGRPKNGRTVGSTVSVTPSSLCRRATPS